MAVRHSKSRRAWPPSCPQTRSLSLPLFWTPASAAVTWFVLGQPRMVGDEPFPASEIDDVRAGSRFSVTPAKAGIQCLLFLDPRLPGGDDLRSELPHYVCRATCPNDGQAGRVAMSLAPQLEHFM